MHASSVIFEEKNGKFSPKIITKLKELSYPKDPQNIRTKSFENGVKTLAKLIKLIPKYKNSSNLIKIQEEFPKVCRKLFEFVQPTKKYRNILNHGDLWINNLMFKYDESENPIECKIIDFQFARYTPPAMDLVTFMFSSSNREFRELHLKPLLNTYCDVFESELKANSVSLKALSRQEILESFEEYKIAGLIEATIFAHLVLPSEIACSVMKSPDEYEKFLSQCREEICTEAFEDDNYRNRVTELLTELIDEFIL